jgi:hypothetical protein
MTSTVKKSTKITGCIALLLAPFVVGLIAPTVNPPLIEWSIITIVAIGLSFGGALILYRVTGHSIVARLILYIYIVILLLLVTNAISTIIRPVS